MQDAEEIVQDVLMAALKGLGAGERSGEWRVEESGEEDNRQMASKEQMAKGEWPMAESLKPEAWSQKPMANGQWPMADKEQLKSSAWRADASLKSWIYSIARHKAMDALRRKYAQKRSAKIIPLHPEPAEDEPLPFEPADFMHPGVLLETQEQMQLFFSGINALPMQQKEALLLAKFEQMPVKDIAEIMGTTPKAVESLLQRAKQNFRSFLAERGINLNKTTGHGTT